MKIIKEVRNFILNEKSFWVCTNDYILEFKDDFTYEYKNNKDKILIDVNETNKTFIIGDGTNYQIKNKFCETILETNIFGISFFDTLRIVATTFNEFSLMDFKSRDIIFKMQHIPSKPFKLDDYILLKNSSEYLFKKLTFEGEIVWELNIKKYFNEELKVFNKHDFYFNTTKIIGSYDNKLWVVLKNGWLVNINSFTGEIQSTILNPKFYPDNFKIKTDKNDFNFRFQIVEDKLINLSHNFYFEILQDDSGNYYQVAYDMREEYSKNNVDNASSPVLQGERWPVIGDLLLYGHSGDSNYEDNLVLFNYKTRKVVKSFSLDVILNKSVHYQYKHPLISRMVRHRDKIYIHYKPFGSKIYALAIINIDELKIEDTII